MKVEHEDKKVKNLPSPVAGPTSPSEEAAWQESNKGWWESFPMRYDWREKVDGKPGSKAYFKWIDDRFFVTAATYLPVRRLPFDQLIPFQDLSSKDVLEIGVGHGSHAELLCRHSRSFTGIDLTETASRMTSRRFELHGLQGRILQMDAQNLVFPDQSFDFIWSWGVIHHSANTGKVLKEMYRVLRPGGEAVVMVYHRSFWKYYVECGLMRGLVGRQLFRHSLNRILQNSTDGAIARFYKPAEFSAQCENLFASEFSVYGQKNELLPIPAGRVKSALTRALPDGLAGLFTHHLRFGSFLVARLKKRS